MGHTIVPVRRNEVIVSVPDEVKQELEEFYAYLQDNEGEAGLVTFETDDGQPDVDALNLWQRQARSYLETREAGTLVFRKLRTDALADHSMRFTIKAPGDEKPRGRQAATAAAK